MSSRRSSRMSSSTTPLVCIKPPRVGRNATCVSLCLPVTPKNLVCVVCTPKLDGSFVRKQRKTNKKKAKQNRCRQPWHDYWLNHQNLIYVKFREEVRHYLSLPIEIGENSIANYEAYRVPLCLLDENEIRHEDSKGADVNKVINKVPEIKENAKKLNETDNELLEMGEKVNATNLNFVPLITLAKKLSQSEELYVMLSDKEKWQLFIFLVSKLDHSPTKKT